MSDPAPGGADFVRVRADNPGPMTLSGTNTYVVGRDPAWVIDPGPDDAAHIDAVQTEGDGRGGIGGVLLTHSHADHSAGVERLGAPLRWGAVSEGDELQPAPTQSAVADAHPTQSAVADAHTTQSAVADALQSGANDSALRQPVESTPFVALLTPGHAADHACFVWDDVCFCGDLILGEGSTIVPPRAFGGSLGDYMLSLERVREIGAALFAPGHGEWIVDPEAKIDEYLAHRRERESKLVAAIERGERSRAALLDSAWGDVPEVLRRAAAMAMQSHLEKLEAEGRLDSSELSG